MCVKEKGNCALCPWRLLPENECYFYEKQPPPYYSAVRISKGKKKYLECVFRYSEFVTLAKEYVLQD